jgi:formylglycine-generating enzyme required for sulfatase activity
MPVGSFAVRFGILAGLLALSAGLLLSHDPTQAAPVPLAKRWPKAITNSIGMKFVRIPAGKFMMGSPKSEKDRFDDEGPQHEVEITKAFYLGVYTVTQAEYQKVMGSNPSYFSRDGSGKDQVKGLDTSQFPVEQVSWDDAVAFCQKLTALEKEMESKRAYRLPTEVELEYSCRAGTKTAFHCGDSLKSDQANFNNNLGRTCKVGSYKPNAWGLYDMTGNVYQWCSDWYDKDYYKVSSKKDPQGPKSVSENARVLRGGSWNYDPRRCRAAYRHCVAPSFRYYSYGCRVVCLD